MPHFFEGIAVGIGSLLFTLLLVYMIRSKSRNQISGTNDPESVYVPVLGTIYAIFLAFMIFVVWSRYYEATQMVTSEANAVTDIFGLARGLPHPYRNELQQFCVDYAKVVDSSDWAVMAQGNINLPSEPLVLKNWENLAKMNSDPPVDTVVKDHITGRWTDLMDHRRSRMLYSRIRLPIILYTVLILGGVLTVLSAAIFSAESFVVHALKACMLALMISLMLYAIFALDHPFQGRAPITSAPFTRAYDIMQSDLMLERK